MAPAYGSAPPRYVRFPVLARAVCRSCTRVRNVHATASQGPGQGCAGANIPGFRRPHRMTATMIRPHSPYGLTHQQQLGERFTRPPELADVVYDPALQLNLVDGTPLVDREDLLITCTVTWGTTDRD